MEFGSTKEEFCQEGHHHQYQHNNNNQSTGKAKLQFSHHNSSSSSSPCSLWEQQTGCWLGKKEEGDEAMVVAEEEGRSGSVVSMAVEKEHMFDKVVTPSDVGKLNRLVIPKQHAEKYFPLDSSANEKGLLLNFEDRNGKAWRFRYSYWNSSQSYVMTKGWSRFVKDKKLDAGDIVSFQRGVGELGKDRLYIDWRRRPDAPDPVSSFPLQHHHHHHHGNWSSFHRSIPWSPLLMRPPPPSSLPATLSRDHLHLSQMSHFLNRNGFYGGGGGGMGSVYYLRSQPLQSQPLQLQPLQMGEWQHHHQYQHQQHYHQHQHQQEENTMVFDSVPVVQGKAAAKRLRLFGVNMDCPISDTDDDDNEIDIVTLQHASMPTIQPHHQQQLASSQQAAASHQLRLYNNNGTAIDFLNKGKASMSLD